MAPKFMAPSSMVVGIPGTTFAFGPYFDFAGVDNNRFIKAAFSHEASWPGDNPPLLSQKAIELSCL